MTVIRPNSISGVTSITAHGGDITYFKSDGTRGNQFTHNVSSTGVITATKFVGPIEGNLSNGTINAASGTITGNLNVGGVLTYEDVTNVDSVGVITARDGLRVTGIATISGAVSIGDSIVHTGDTNTSIRFPAADTFAVETAGVERLRIGSAGQIGIGGANYGTDGQVLTSKGASAAIQWATISTGRPIPTRNLRYVINFDYPDYTNANDTNKRKMVTPFMDTDSMYSNSGTPFQYMHKTGG